VVAVVVADNHRPTMPFHHLTSPQSVIELAMTGLLLAATSCSQGPLHVNGRDSSGRDDDLDLPATGDAPGAGTRSDSAAPPDGAPDLSAGVSEFEACRDAIVAQCERLYVCQGFDVGDCVQYAVDRCPEYYFGPRSLRTAHEVEACARSIRTASCTDFLLGTATQCLLGGTGAAGAPCSGPSECASNLCTDYFPACGTCAVPLGLGEACDGSGGHCSSGTLCHPTSRTCVAIPLLVANAGPGEACDLKGSPPMGCTGDLVCAPISRTGSAGTCVRLPRSGETCLVFGGVFHCATPLQCGQAGADGGLIWMCADRMPCGTALCDDISFCYQTDTGQLVCRPYAGMGEACSLSEGSERRCSPDARCTGGSAGGDAGIVYDGTCVARGRVDLDGACDGSSPCRTPLVCQSGRCARFDPSTCF
jgi:hypothetical protein